MTDTWYYAVDHQRHGPVQADDLVRLYQAGRILPGTPVWQEGMGDWRPLADFAQTLGLHALPPPLPAAAGPSAAPPARRGMHWIWIVLLVLAGLSVPVLGILAAIALPAYNDYVARSGVAGLLVETEPARQRIAESVAAGTCPQAGPALDATGQAGDALADVLAPLRAREEVGAVRAGTGTTGECELEVRFGPAAERRLAGTRILWSLDKKGGWHCSSDAPSALLPTHCRN